MEYIKKSDDKQYRKVNLNQTGVPKYTDFVSDNQSVTYPANTVLEILRYDGTTHLEYDGGGIRKTVNYALSGSQIRLSADIPLARLWVRDNTGLLYKVPSHLPADEAALPSGGYVSFALAGHAGTVSLVGDKYFDMVYDIG